MSSLAVALNSVMIFVLRFLRFAKTYFILQSGSNIYGFLALLYGNGFIRLPNTDWYYHSHGLFRRIYSPVYLPIPPPDHIPYGLPRLVRPFCLPVNRPKMPAVHVPYGLVASGESNSLEAESKMSPAIKPVSEGKNEAVDRTMAVASNTERLGVTETVKNEDHSSIVDCKQSETVCQKQRTSLTDNLSAAVAENKDFSAIATSCQDKQIKIAKCEENDAVLTATLENDIASASIVGAVVNDDHIVVPVSNQHEQIEIDVATERDDISSAIAEAVEKEDLDITTSKIQNEQIEFAEIVNETVDSIVAAFIEAVEFEDQSANVVRNQDDQIEVSEKAIERIDFTETITSDKESAVITEIVAPRDCDDQVKFAGGENEALMIVETIEDNDHTVIMSNIQDELIELAERENESVDCTLTTESDKQASASIAEAVEQDHAAFAERDNDKQVEFFVRENETVDHSVTSTSDIVSAVITETVVCSDVACNNKELSSENANPLLLTLDNGVEQSDVVPCVEENIKSADRAMADSCACTNNEQSMVPCNNENFILTDLSTSIVDQMVTVDSDSVVKLPATDDILSMDCSSVDEPDIPSCRDELMEKTDIELFSQYKSGEEILASTDDLFSTQYHSGSEETVTNVDIMMAASNCDDASCNECDDRKQDDDPCDDSLLENVHQTPTTSCMNEEQSRLPCDEESIKNTDIFYTQVDGLQQLDAPYDEVFTVKENSCQTATSLCSDTDIARSDVSYDEAAFENMDILYTQVDGVDRLDGKNADQCFINSCINAEPFDVPCNEASTANMASGLTECNSLVLSELVRARMECNENIMDNSELTVTTNTQCDVSCDHGTDDCCTTLDARVPFLKRNRKRKFRTPTFQSPLHLKNSINPELLADICSPNLNVPLIMPSAKTSQRDQYRVHILQKESNGRVLTTTMSFFLKAYQCHFCEFNGVSHSRFEVRYFYFPLELTTSDPLAVWYGKYLATLLEISWRSECIFSNRDH